jgi:hypothetical protein
MRLEEQEPLPGFSFVPDGGEELPPPPLWVVELLRLSLPFGVDVILTLSVVQSYQRREGEGAVE